MDTTNPKRKSQFTLDEIDAYLEHSASVSKPNLLANWYFPNPVNQLGETEYSTASTVVQTIDRWRIQNALGKIVVEEDGIRIVNESSTYNLFFEQVLLNDTVEGATVCASALISEVSGTAYMYLRYTDDTLSGSDGALSPGLKSLVRSGKSARRFVIQVNVGASVKLTAAKLEYGSVSTLARKDTNGGWVLNETPDYRQRLEECKWVFERFSAKNANLAIGFGSGTTSVIYVTVKAAPKRANPKAFTANQIANLRYGTGSLSSTPTSVTLYAADNVTGTYVLAVGGVFTAGTLYRLGIISGGVLDFDANL